MGHKLKVLINELKSATGLEEQTSFDAQSDEEQSALDSCLCSSCPSYARGAIATDPQEKAYCMHGESNLEVKRAGCLCPSCEIYKKNKYIGWYFCVTGRAESASSPGDTGVSDGEGEPEGEGEEGVTPENTKPTAGLQAGGGRPAPAVQ